MIFTSQRTPGDQGYDEMSRRMNQLVAEQPGFLGLESARGADGFGLTICYWRSLEDIRAWRRVEEHQAAQQLGRERWYERYHVRVARLEPAYELDYRR